MDGETAAGISVRWLRKAVSVGFGNSATNSHFQRGAARILTAAFFSASVSPYSLLSCLHRLPESNYLCISVSLCLCGSVSLPPFLPSPFVFDPLHSCLVKGTVHQISVFSCSVEKWL